MWPRRIAEVFDHRLGEGGKGPRPCLDVVAGERDAGLHDLRVEPAVELGARQLGLEDRPGLGGGILGEDFVGGAVGGGLRPQRGHALDRRDLGRRLGL